MYPTLIKFGPFAVHAYGFFIAVGFLVGMGIAVSHAKKSGLPFQKIADLGFYVILSSILGARVFYIFTDWERFSGNLLDMFKIWEGGLVFYGGLIAAMLTGIWFIKKNSLPALKTLDVFAPALAIGHAFGRIGCFFAGCCHGAPTNVPWAVTFTHPESLAVKGVPLHPVQLYDSAGELAIFFLLLTLRKSKRFDGELIFTYGILYSILRFTVEFLRGDATKVMVSGILSIAQIISIGLFFVSLVMYEISRRKGQ